MKLYCDEEETTHLHTRTDDNLMGVIDFELNDFLNEKITKREYYKFFNSEKIPILSWAVKFTIGIVPSCIDHLGHFYDEPKDLEFKSMVDRKYPDEQNERYFDRNKDDIKQIKIEVIYNIY